MGGVSIQLVSPARGENYIRIHANGDTTDVSIQLVSPARGEILSILIIHLSWHDVSIQLVSPARGERIDVGSMTPSEALSFHSIGFPCERGVLMLLPLLLMLLPLFTFNWFPLREGSPAVPLDRPSIR